MSRTRKPKPKETTVAAPLCPPVQFFALNPCPTCGRQWSEDPAERAASMCCGQPLPKVPVNIVSPPDEWVPIQVLGNPRPMVMNRRTGLVKLAAHVPSEFQSGQLEMLKPGVIEGPDGVHAVEHRFQVKPQEPGE